MKAVTFAVAVAIAVILVVPTGCVSSVRTALPAALPSGATGEDRELTRRAAILRAEDRRIPDDAIRYAIVDPDPAMRARAARGLGRIGDPSVIDLLRDALNDDDPVVRTEAVFALGLIGAPDTVRLLSERASDPSPRVRAMVADACRRIASPPFEEVLEELATDADPVVRESVFYASAALTEPGRILGALYESLSNGSPALRRAAVYGLARIGRETPGGPRQVDVQTRQEARHALRPLAGDRDPEIRRYVARGLSAPINDAERRVLDALLTDPDPGVRIQAIRSYAFPGGSPQAFRAAFVDPDPLVVIAAISALGRMGPDFANTLVEYIVRDERPWVRLAAFEALRNADPVLASQVSNGLSRDLDPSIRELAARSLIVRSDQQSLEILDRLIADEDGGVRAAAAVSLASRAGTLHELLAEVLADSDSRVQLALVAAARQRIAKSGTTEAELREALEFLAGAWDRFGEPEGSPLRLEILDAAAEAGPVDQARSIQERGLSDVDIRVRHRASDHLRTVFGRTDIEPVPAADHGREYYEQIVQWASAPRAAIVTVQREGFLPGRFTIRLDTASAPLTTWNFARLAEEGVLAGLPFHRVLPDFLAQTGDLRGDGLGDPGWSTRDEPAPIRFWAGTVAMASPGRDRAGSLWFIVLSMQPHLEPRYTAFGSVVQNFSGVVQRIFPGDRVVSVEIYEGDGTEPLPPLDETNPPG